MNQKATMNGLRFFTALLTTLAIGPGLAALGVTEGASAVFVGDRPFDDILGARQVGMRAVLRRNPAVPEHEIEPDATFVEVNSGRLEVASRAR